jgi:hypothetical protein
VNLDVPGPVDFADMVDLNNDVGTIFHDFHRTD